MRVGVFGAGAIGCTIAARLAHGGHEVRLVGRARVREGLAAGVTLTRWGEPPVHVPADALRFVDDATGLVGCDVVALTVKTADTEAAAHELSEALPADVPLVSLQNGVDAIDTLRRVAGPRPTWPGMVPFNIVWSDPATLHQGTSGPVVLPREAEALVNALRAGGCPARSHRDVRAVQWGKLLLNLNNAVNALSGLPLREQLSDAGYRRILSDVIREGQAILRVSGIRSRGVGRIQPRLAPWVLRLPDLLFFRVASAMIAIDPAARSSMQDDLARGRPTEVDGLNGTLVRLGEAHGHPAPLQRRLVQLVHEAEAADTPPRWHAGDLARALYQP